VENVDIKTGNRGDGNWLVGKFKRISSVRVTEDGLKHLGLVFQLEIFTLNEQGFVYGLILIKEIWWVRMYEDDIYLVGKRKRVMRPKFLDVVEIKSLFKR